MPTTTSLIAKQTVGAAGASIVTFNNIPQTFTDLKLIMSARSNVSAVFDFVRVYFNGVEANGTMRELFGYNGSFGTNPANNQRLNYISGNTATASTFGSGELYIPNYTLSNFKSSSADSVSQNNNSLAVLSITANLWSSTAAITSITLVANDGNFMELSDFSLYGISNSNTQNTSVPYALGGDIIRTDGSFWYHTFLYSGTFAPLKELTCDYLVVAGGGGGGGGDGDTAQGGGGAGGYRTSIGGTPLTLVAQNYLAVVGAGGRGGLSNGAGNIGTNGGNSIFASIESAGGGKGANFGSGGGRVSAIAGAGGSGGGGCLEFPTGGAGNTPATSPSQGNNGGNQAVDIRSGGGGGGAGAVGSNNPSTDTGGAGGAGVANSISGSSVTYAGGGGGGGQITGGAGGTGGGGAGGGNGAGGTSGTAGTGGGGGGQSNRSSGPNGQSGGNGGSGIIIVRYAV